MVQNGDFSQHADTAECSGEGEERLEEPSRVMERDDDQRHGDGGAQEDSVVDIETSDELVVKDEGSGQAGDERAGQLEEEAQAYRDGEPGLADPV